MDFFGDDNTNEIDQCDACGTTENLVFKFAENFQTGKSKHLCATCKAESDKNHADEVAARNAKNDLHSFIAETDK